MTPGVILNTRAEFLKVHRTNAVWLTLAGAAFIPAVNFLKLIGRPDIFASQLKNDPWAFMINDNWAPAASLFLPLYVILVISLVVQIEYGNNTWKQVYASPRSYADIYFSKFVVICILILVLIVSLSLLLIAMGYLVEMVNSDYVFTDKSVPWTDLSRISMKMFAAIFAMAALQYWLSLWFKSFVTSIGIGMALLTGGFMIRQWEYISYYPYMQTLLTFFPDPAVEEGTLNKVILNSVVEGLMVFGLGFYSIYRRKEKG
jgi:hypothetical protein